MNTKHIKFVMIFLFILSFLIGDISIAQVPYRNYTYNYWGQAVPAPPAYTPYQVIDGSGLGIGEFDRPRDIFVRNDMIYLLDTGNNRIIQINQEFKVVDILKEFEKDGVRDSFNNPRGIFVTGEGNIYVADTDNRRILEFSPEKELIREILEPTSGNVDLVPEQLQFRPISIGVDPVGRIYTIIQDSFEGLFHFNIDGDFVGFVGAPRVNPNPLDLFWRQFATETQRERMSLFLPISYRNLRLDDEGFIFTVVGGTANSESVKRLNPTGADTLNRNAFRPGDNHIASQYPEISSSVFLDVLPRENGIYSILTDVGRIFTYDDQGNLLYTFGGIGHIQGTFRRPVAIEKINQEIVVVDERLNQILTFKPTQYALDIHSAINYYELGLYDESVATWQQVLSQNINYELAYRGIGRALFRDRNYGEAMTYFKLANSRSDYSDVFAYYRQEYIIENFSKLIISLLFFLFFIYAFKKINLLGKVNEKYISATNKDINRQSKIKKTIKALRYSFYVIFHPFSGFWDLKHEKKGNLTAGIIILTLVSMTYIFMRRYTGFIYNDIDISQINVYFELISVILPFLLWCVVNWACTTLMDGKGTFADIFIATAYGLTPIVIINIPLTIISNYLTLNESSFYYFFISLGVIWALGLVFLGNMVIHDYLLTKAIIASICIIVGMGTTLFIGILFFVLIRILYNFIDNLYSELVLRI